MMVSEQFKTVPGGGETRWLRFAPLEPGVPAPFAALCDWRGHRLCGIHLFHQVPGGMPVPLALWNRFGWTTCGAEGRRYAATPDFGHFLQVIHDGVSGVPAPAAGDECAYTIAPGKEGQE